MVQFAENEDVAFADVVLSEGGPRGPEGTNPGAGGWPTIRYYNSMTGTSGEAYKKKIDSAPMCEELGPKHGLLPDYIEEAGNTSLCNVVTKAGCSEKEIKYIDKMAAKDQSTVEGQLRRLEGMKEKKMKPDLKAWLGKRLKILKGLARTKGETEVADGEKTEL